MYEQFLDGLLRADRLRNIRQWREWKRYLRMRRRQNPDRPIDMGGQRDVWIGEDDNAQLMASIVRRLGSDG